CCSAQRVYIRRRSPANRAASSPPVPARISTITSLSSLGSLGTRARRSWSSRAAWRAWASAICSSSSARPSAALPHQRPAVGRALLALELAGDDQVVAGRPPGPVSADDLAQLGVAARQLDQ